MTPENFEVITTFGQIFIVMLAIIILLQTALLVSKFGGR